MVNETIYSFIRDDGIEFNVKYTGCEEYQYPSRIDKFTKKEIPSGNRHIYLFAVTLDNFCLTNIFVRVDDDGYHDAYADNPGAMTNGGNMDIINRCILYVQNNC